MTGTGTIDTDRLTPVPATERVDLIDILRGFALLGILLVNFWGSSSDAVNRLDKIVSDVLSLAVSSSFYPLFSFLFGLGFALQLLRARQRGTELVWLYLRRMLALFLIGSFHAIVIWDGDVLVDYAVLGMLLIPLHRLRDRWLWPIVAIPLVLGLWGPQVRAFIAGASRPAAVEANALRDWDEGLRTAEARNLTQRYEADPNASRMAAFKSALSDRWQSYRRTVRRHLSRNFFLDDILAFFVLGLIAGRRRILQEAHRHRVLLLRAAAAGLIASVSGALVLKLLEPEDGVMFYLAHYASDYGTTIFYIGAISLAVTGSGRAAALFRPFAAAGRIGLTNYLMQSLMMTVVFSRYGLGLPDPTTAVWVLINLVFFFVVQVPFSWWWTQRYRFGPAEWVWRSLTYGERQPMHIAPVLRPAGLI